MPGLFFERFGKTQGQKWHFFGQKLNHIGKMYRITEYFLSLSDVTPQRQIIKY